MTTTTKTAKSYKEAMALVEQFHASRPDCYFAYNTENYSDDYKTTKRFFTGFGNDGSAIPFAMIEFVVAGKLDSVRVLDTCRGIAVDIKIEIPEAAIEETAEKITVESARAQGWSLEEFFADNAGLSLAEYREKKAAEEAAFAARELHNKIVDSKVEIGHIDAEIDYLSGLINDLAKNHFNPAAADASLEEYGNELGSELADNLNKLAALNAQLASLESKNVETDTEAPEATVEVKTAKFEEGKTYFITWNEDTGRQHTSRYTVEKRTPKTVVINGCRSKICDWGDTEAVKVGYCKYLCAKDVFGEDTVKAQAAQDAWWNEQDKIASQRTIELNRDADINAIMAEIRVFQHHADVKSLKKQIANTVEEVAFDVIHINYNVWDYLRGNPNNDVSEDGLNNSGKSLTEKLAKLADLKAQLSKLAPYEVFDEEAAINAEIESEKATREKLKKEAIERMANIERGEIESTPLTTADAIDATIDAEQALADVNTDKNLKETIIMTTTKIANTDNVKQQDDFTAELAKLKAAADEAKITFIKAQDAHEQTKNALKNFLNDTAFKLKEKLDALPLDYTITLKKTGGSTYHVVDFSEIYIGAYHIGCDVEFRFENWKFRVIARYDTPAQVETVINQLKAAIVRGDNEFTFPTIEELNSPIANTDDDTEDAVDVFSLLPTLDELNDVELSEPQDVVDSLTRAMETALLKMQNFCREHNLTAARNEMQLYSICSDALRKGVRG